MRDWQTLHSTNTFQEMVDLWNKNRDSSEFIDSMVGTILCNGVLFNGNETVEGKLIRPLEDVGLSGTVNSDTIFDNFNLYFRDNNVVVPVNNFPVDFLNYADGKLHFLYFKQDLTYRISDYMFGKADEVLIARFIINNNSTWRQMYIMAQRAGTPMYNAADEFYTVDGCYIKTPGGLNLSMTSGTVKRSGIDFTDRISPDIRSIYNIASEKLNIRYNNTANEIDYTQATRDTIITNKYMTYNMNKKLKIDAEKYIASIQNLYYLIEQKSNNVADELHTAIIAGGELEDLQQIVMGYTDFIDLIYSEVNRLYTLLGDPVLSSVDRTDLNTNKTQVDTYLSQNLKNKTVITEAQVQAIRTVPAYILPIDSTVTDNPLDSILKEIQDDLDGISFDLGVIKNVAAGKFTIQRILWDVYENTLIVQYGDKVYDTFPLAVEGTDLVEYPAPFGKTIYIPLAILIIKSGTTSISTDIESIIIDRRWIEVDQEMTAYTDYIARAQADKAREIADKLLNGDLAAAKADSLKCTINGQIQYKNGDYYLDYDNLRDKPTVIDDLTHDSFNAKQPLSAYQGYLLNQNKVNRDGDDRKYGTLTANKIIPQTTKIYDLGSSDKYWRNVYANGVYVAGSTYSGYGLSRSMVSGGNSNATPYSWLASRDGNTTKNYLNFYDDHTLFGGNYIEISGKGRCVYSSDSSIYNIVANANISSQANRTVTFNW